jgi:hypothetical protein
VPAGELGDEAQRAARPVEREDDHALAGRGLDGREPRSLELAPEELLEGRRLAGPRRAGARRVDAGDVGLGGEEDPRRPGAAEQLEGERPLRVRARPVDPRSRERRELRDDGLDLGGGEGHDAIRTQKMLRPPGGRPRRSTREELSSTSCSSSWWSSSSRPASSSPSSSQPSVLPPRNVHS